ncbi:MAG TPA: hypothetical protein VNA19_03450 [Pyrinomonadaceae bacterium]|jgi:hypothetical protein|nr:hypothetical protein [Pyrinomonadaceae bacterium]
MSAQALATARFVRKTTLGPDEYRKNFKQLDCDIISTLVSAEASRVTPQMSKIYLSLVSAPTACWEREGVLYFGGEGCAEERRTAWPQLLKILRVASGTAKKALAWMHAQGIIGYFAGRNGVGIRIFINRAVSSIGSVSERRQKNLQLVPTAKRASRTSTVETPFKESFACLEEILDSDNPRAPENGATGVNESEKKSPRTDPAGTRPTRATTTNAPAPHVHVPECETPAQVSKLPRTPEEMWRNFAAAFEPCVEQTLRRALAREHERTREWFDKHAIPKAARVAQREAYSVLRTYGLIERRAHVAAPRVTVEPARECVGEARACSEKEVREWAETCVSLLEVQGRAIERTLAEMCAETGGFLSPEDAARVREAARLLVASQGENI